MARSILAAQSLSRNDISTLAQLFEVSFDYFINHNSPFFTDYLRALRTVVGLGFTSVLIDGDLLSIYRPYLDHFCSQNEGDFKANPNSKAIIAHATANMAVTAAAGFSALKYPRYYQEFAASLEYAIAKIPTLTVQQKEVDRMLTQLSLR